MATDTAPDDSTFAVAPTAVSAAAALGGLVKTAPAWAVSLLVHVIVLLSAKLVIDATAAAAAAAAAVVAECMMQQSTVDKLI